MPTHRPRSPANRSRANPHSNSNNNTNNQSKSSKHVTSAYGSTATTLKIPDRAKLLAEKLERSDEGSADIVDWYGHEYYVDLERTRSCIPYFAEYEKDMVQALKDEAKVKLGLTPGFTATKADTDPMWIFDLMGSSEPKSGLLAPAVAPVVVGVFPSLSGTGLAEDLSHLSLSSTHTDTDTLVVPLDLVCHNALEELHNGVGLASTPDVCAVKSTLLHSSFFGPSATPALSATKDDDEDDETPTPLGESLSSPDSLNPDSLKLVKVSKPKGLLFLGGWKMSYGKFPRKHKIKLIVNCARIPDIMEAGSAERMQEWVDDSERLNKEGTRHHRIPWFDIERQRLWDKQPWDQLSAAVVAIHSALSQGQNVLVHCRKGRSRSATVVLAYLMSRHGFNKMEALIFLKDKRPSVSPNTGFAQQLVEFMKTGSNGALKHLRERVGMDCLPEREEYLKHKRRHHKETTETLETVTPKEEITVTPKEETAVTPEGAVSVIVSQDEITV